LSNSRSDDVRTASDVILRSIIVESVASSGRSGFNANRRNNTGLVQHTAVVVTASRGRWQLAANSATLSSRDITVGADARAFHTDNSEGAT